MLLRKAFKVLVQMATYGVATALCFTVLLFGYFAFLEAFPGARNALSPDQTIPYYRFARQYVRDSDLALMWRPNLSSQGKINGSYRDNPLFADFLEIIPTNSSSNSLGFPGREHPPATDIVVLGDSFQMAHETHEDSFSNFLAAKTGLSVKNLGVAWWGPEQYLRVFERHTPDKGVQIAIFSFFSGNDLRDIAEYSRWEGTGVYYHGYSSPSIWNRFEAFLGDLKRQVDRVLLMNFRAPIARARGRYIDTERQNLIHVELPGKSLFEKFTYFASVESGEELRDSPEWKRYEEIAGFFLESCRRREATPLFLFIPSKSEIYAPFTTTSSGTRWLQKRDAQIRSIRHREDAFLSTCSKLQLECISLFEPFLEVVKRGERPYYQIDAHWSRSGRRAAAEVVAERLLSALALPGEKRKRDSTLRHQ